MSPGEETPIPCRRCGAPMIEDASPHAHDAVAVRCEYCQSREELPADHAQRVTMLRARLTQIRAAQQALEAPALALANVAEAYPRMIAPGVLMMFAVVALTTFQSVTHTLALPEPARTSVWLSALAGPLQLVFVVVSVFGGAVLGLRQYAAELRPALEARPADQANRYRCRGCGGAIDAASRHGAFVTCSYCGAQNILGASSAAHRAAQLDREVDEYRARARGQQPVIAAAAERYKRRIRVVTGVVAVGNIAFMFAMSQAQVFFATMPR